MKRDLIRAWKDPHYRRSMSEQQRAQLPENPAGAYEVDRELLATVTGGKKGASEGWFCTVSGECNGGSSCCFWPLSW